MKAVMNFYIMLIAGCLLTRRGTASCKGNTVVHGASQSDNNSIIYLVSYNRTSSAHNVVLNFNLTYTTAVPNIP